MAHAMMFELGWEKVAARIATWLDATLAAPLRDREAAA
jgi:hypothetical protein